MDTSGLLNSLLAAIQASLSVLLVIFYGACAARLRLLDSATGKSISKICVRFFLPALLFSKIGSELHAGSAHRYLVVLVWAILCHLISFLIGAAAHLALGMPDWITAAIMFNNTTSYPLLLVQSLDETGILSSLIMGNESTSAAIERAKSYFLVFATISSCLTFAVGPRLIDSEHAPDEEQKDTVHDVDDAGENGADREDEEAVSPTDETSLLPAVIHRPSVTSVSFFPSKRQGDGNITTKPMPRSRRPSLVAKKKWHRLSDRTRWWLLFLFDFLNAPLLGAVIGAIIGLVPALHRAFFNDTQDGGIFTAWLTASLKTIGGLFVPLPVVVAGVSLYTSYQAARSNPNGEESKTPWATTLFVLGVRFVLWPVISIAALYGLAKRTDVLGSDPIMWFTMMLMPTGPPAMKLITMVQVSDADEADEHKVAKLLTISYMISPVLAFTVVGSLKASQAAIEA